MLNEIRNKIILKIRLYQIHKLLSDIQLKERHYFLETSHSNKNIFHHGFSAWSPSLKELERDQISFCVACYNNTLACTNIPIAVRPFFKNKKGENKYREAGCMVTSLSARVVALK